MNEPNKLPPFDVPSHQPVAGGIAARIRAVVQAHSAVPHPDCIGRRVAMPGK
jgi:hypothetical protein